MKWERIHPQEGIYDFTKADYIPGFAETHTMPVRGHCLVWFDQTPDWVFHDSDGKKLSCRSLQKVYYVLKKQKFNKKCNILKQKVLQWM